MKCKPIFAMIYAVLLISACATQAIPATTSESAIGMPNSSSVHSTDDSGNLEMSDQARGQTGYSVLADESKREERAYLRSENAQETTKRIRFQPGATTAIEQGSLATNDVTRYVLGALVDQVMSVNVSSSPGKVILAISGADGTVLISDHAGTTHWSGQLPVTQDYFIDVISVGAKAANYTLQVTIPPQPKPTPEPPSKRIHFKHGDTTAVEHGAVAAEGMDRYMLKAKARQHMSVNVTSSQGEVILVIYGSDGTVLISDHAGTTHWSGRLPSTQDYIIDVKSEANEPIEYTLQITIPPKSDASPAA